MHSFLKVRNLEEARCRQSWIEFGRYRSVSRRSVKRVSRKRKDHRPHAVKFEDRSQKETEREQRCTRNKACNLAKHTHKLREKDKAAFYFSAEEWVLPAASSKELDEREFVIDSGVSMHMKGEITFNSTELETMRTSRRLTTVRANVNGDVQTREGGVMSMSNNWTYSTLPCLLKKLPQCFHWEILRRTWVHVSLEKRSKSTLHQK